MMNVFVGDTKDAKKGREWLKKMLEEQNVVITFTKKDGTERIMNCTLNEKALPVVQNDFGDEDSTVRQKSKDALAVWDVEAQGWRSFRWDSIKAVNFSIGE